MIQSVWVGFCRWTFPRSWISSGYRTKDVGYSRRICTHKGSRNLLTGLQQGILDTQCIGCNQPFDIHFCTCKLAQSCFCKQTGKFLVLWCILANIWVDRTVGQCSLTCKCSRGESAWWGHWGLCNIPRSCCIPSVERSLSSFCLPSQGYIYKRQEQCNDHGYSPHK